MNLTCKLFCVLISLATGMACISCHNEMEPSDNYSPYFLPNGVVVAPDAMVWSGSEVLSNSFKDNRFPTTKADDDSGLIEDKYNAPHVEVHLSLENVNTLPEASRKFEITDVASLLSIYIRYPLDVEVVIPAPVKIYCDPDSLLTKETGSGYKYQGERTVFNNFIDGRPVNLYIEYVAETDDNLTNPRGAMTDSGGNLGNGYIRVYTEGIDDDIISYCNDNFEDGVNFKVYTYFKSGNHYADGKLITLDKSDLKEYFFNRSLVNFDWQQTDVISKEYPDLYVNSFSVDWEENPIESECSVRILGDKETKIDDNGLFLRDNPRLKNGTRVVWNDKDEESFDIERNHFKDPYQENHYNGSPYNLIYVKKDPNP